MRLYLSCWALAAALSGAVRAIRFEEDFVSSVEEAPSIRAFDFRGFTNALQIRFTNGSKMDVKTPYFSLAGSAQSNPCKLVMYRSAKHVLQKSPAEIKVDAVIAAKVQLVELCKSFASQGSLKAACSALDLDQESGRIKVLGKTSLKPEEGSTEEPEEEEDSGDATAASGEPLLDNAMTKTIVKSVQMYTCMVKEGSELSRVPVKKMEGKNWVTRGLAKGVNFAKRKASQAKSAVSKIVTRLGGSAIRRFSKQLSGSKVCLGECKKWKHLLKTVVADQATYPESCPDFLSDLGMMELKGDPNERIGSIDLSSLHAGETVRKVELSQGKSLRIAVQSTVSPETVKDIDLGSSLAPGYEEVSSPWEDLQKQVSSRLQQCRVDKVGVFNLGLKKRWNGFQLKERFPWKVIFLSRAAIQIHSQHAHGKNYGYDLHGDPAEIEFPCKWMTKARERGLKPRRRLLPVSDLNFTFFHKKIALPKYLYEPSKYAMLWLDEDNKIPLPEWMRGMRKVWDVDKDTTKLPSWMLASDGRDSKHYSKYMAWDMRGLHEASDSPAVLGKLRDLGWQADALVVVERGQAESAQLSGTMVNSVYPYNKQLAGLQSLPTDPFRHGGENKLWSIYDYTESYLQNCFSVDATSLPSANDGASDLGGDLTATISLCTNSFEGGERSSLPTASKIARDDIMSELVRYFSEGRPAGVQVSSSIRSSCYSETDCTGNTCLMPGNCKENEDNPCPIGHGCSCDTTKTQAIFAVAVAASVLSEGTRNTLAFGPGLIATCEAIGIAGAAFGGLALVPLCPILIPLMFYAVAPLGSDIFMAFILASVIGGLNNCGCVPLSCKASSRLKSNVCALYHSQEKEMINEYHFIPAPGKKCVPTTTMGISGCGLKSCDEEELSQSKLGWHAQSGKMYGHSVGIYNCKKGDFNASDVDTTSQFDYKTFIDLHPNWTELRTNMVPQAQAPTKLSLVEKWTVGLPQGVRKCFEGRTGLRKGIAALCTIKRVAGTLASWAMGMIEKFIGFLVDVVLGALKLVRFVFFTIMSVVTKDIGGKRKWAGQCLSVEDDNVDNSTSLMELEDEDFVVMPQYERLEDRFDQDTLCVQGRELRPCGEVDLSEHYL